MGHTCAFEHPSNGSADDVDGLTVSSTDTEMSMGHPRNDERTGGRWRCGRREKPKRSAFGLFFRALVPFFRGLSFRTFFCMKPGIGSEASMVNEKVASVALPLSANFQDPVCSFCALLGAASFQEMLSSVFVVQLELILGDFDVIDQFGADRKSVGVTLEDLREMVPGNHSACPSTSRTIARTSTSGALMVIDFDPDTLMPRRLAAPATECAPRTDAAAPLGSRPVVRPDHVGHSRRVRYERTSTISPSLSNRLSKSSTRSGMSDHCSGRIRPSTRRPPSARQRDADDVRLKGSAQPRVEPGRGSGHEILHRAVVTRERMTTQHLPPNLGRRAEGILLPACSEVSEYSIMLSADARSVSIAPS